MKQGLPQINKCKVVILSITYNQSQYIEDTLNGFVTQQTDFPFICCVFDDASTDGEQDVLKQWIDNHCNSEKVEIYNHPLANILIAPDKNNSNCIYAIHLHKVNLFGKPEKQELINYWKQFGEYIAICEGDDYWIDSLKLQKQVDFLDKNIDYGLVRTNINQYIQKEDQIIEDFFSNGNWTRIKDTFYDYIIHGWYAAPCSWLYRAIYIEKYKKLQQILQNKNCFTGDILILLCIAKNSKIKYFPESTAMYRVLDKSASHFNSFERAWIFFIKNKNTRTFFAKNESWSFRLKYICIASYEHLIFILRHKKVNFLFKWVIEICRDIYKLFLCN